MQFSWHVYTIATFQQQRFQQVQPGQGQVLLYVCIDSLVAAQVARP